jgi:hypothetical protein
MYDPHFLAKVLKPVSLVPRVLRYIHMVRMSEAREIHSRGSDIRSKNSPHTPTFSFLVSACTYYFYHFSCTLSDSIYTIDIPPRLRNLHNHFLCAIPFKLLLLIYLSRFLGEIREMWSDEFVGYTRIEIFSKASFF